MAVLARECIHCIFCGLFRFCRLSRPGRSPVPPTILLASHRDHLRDAIGYDKYRTDGMLPNRLWHVRHELFARSCQFVANARVASASVCSGAVNCRGHRSYSASFFFVVYHGLHLRSGRVPMQRAARCNATQQAFIKGKNSIWSVLPFLPQECYAGNK